MTLSAPFLSIEKVSLRYGERQLFQDLSLSIHPGERIGLIGRNGSGKSSLVKVLMGLIEPDSGRRSARKALRVAFVQQEFAFDGKTVAEVVRRALPPERDPGSRMEELSLSLEKLGKKLAEESELKPSQESQLHSEMEQMTEEMGRLSAMSVDNIIDGALKFAGMKILKERSTASLSGGQKKRLQIVCALLQEPHVLIMDEPTNHLDVETVEWLEDSVLTILESDRSLLWGNLQERDEKPAFVVVSHDRALLDTLVNQTIELERGQASVFAGGYEDYVQAKAAKEAQLAASQERAANKMRRELDWLKAGVKARTTKQRARMQRAHQLNQKLDLMKTHSAAYQPTEIDLAQSVESGPRLSKQDLVVFQGLTLEREFGGATHCFMRDFDFVLRPGVRLAVVGPNGCGKSTFIHEIFERRGTFDPKASVRFHESAEPTLFDQERERLNAVETVGDLLLPSGGEFVSYGGRTLHIASFLEGFQFTMEDLKASVRSFSGGERARLLLARTLLDESNILLMDEPTNDLDLWTLRDLEESLLRFPGSVIFTSHDRYFLRRVGTHYLTFVGRTSVNGKSVSEWQVFADLDQSLENSSRAALSVLDGADPIKPKTASSQNVLTKLDPVVSDLQPKPKKLTYRDQFRFEELEKLIPELERQNVDISHELTTLYAAAQTAESRKVAEELSRKAKSLTEQIEAAYEELDGLMEKME